MEIIILSGGLGTRLRSVVKDIPKTMAIVNNKPFLERTFDYLQKFDITKAVLAVGYKKEYIEEYFGNKYKNIDIIYSEEKESLGTGGAVKKALKKCSDENILVINGDIYANVNLQEMMEKHLKSNKDITIAVKEMKNVERFGTVKIEDDRIVNFIEKKHIEKGYINIGYYIIKKNVFDGKIDLDKFSLEKDFFEKYAKIDNFGAYKYTGEFVDIGIPEDYNKLCNMLKTQEEE